MRSANSVLVERSVPFETERFLGMGWDIAEENPRSQALATVDFTRVRIVSMLDRGANEDSANGDELIRRVWALNEIPLDVKVFETLWNDQSLIPESWKEKVPDRGGPGLSTKIYFPGTIFRADNGDRCCIFIAWHDDSEWRNGVSWLGQDMSIDCLFSMQHQK
jgi:hypothetical protein